MKLSQSGHSSGKGYVLAIGAANMDIAGIGTRALVAGDSTPGTVRCAAGGVARNVAENLARLGHDARLLSAVGGDQHGRSLLRSTGHAGVDVRHCWVLDDAVSSSYVSLHGPDGDLLAAVNDMAILEHITPERLAPCAELVAGAAALLLDCNLPEPALAWLFAHAPQGPIFVDPVSAFKCRRVLPWLGRVFTLKANRLEVQALWGQPVDSDGAIRAAAAWLHAQGVRQVVLSLGERGAYWSAHGGNAQPGTAPDAASGWQAALPVQVVNDTGAGDALMAGLLHQYLQGAPLEQAVVFALGCAALTLTMHQANHPDLSPDAVARLRCSAATV